MPISYINQLFANWKPFAKFLIFIVMFSFSFFLNILPDLKKVLTFSEILYFLFYFNQSKWEKKLTFELSCCLRYCTELCFFIDFLFRLHFQYKPQTSIKENIGIIYSRNIICVSILFLQTKRNIYLINMHNLAIERLSFPSVIFFSLVLAIERLSQAGKLFI